MNYVEIWREGHAAGMSCVIKAVNDTCGTDFESAEQLIVHMRHLAQAQEFGLSKRDKENNQDLARRIAQQNWLWSDA